MHPKIREGLEFLVGLTIFGTMAIGAGGLFYQSCLKKNTLKDSTVTSRQVTTARDYETGIDFDIIEIELDKYNHCLLINGGVDIGDKLKEITYRNRFLLCPVVIDYKKEGY